MTGRWWVAAVLSLLAWPRAASATRSVQVWPELDLYQPFNDQVRLRVLGQGRLAPGSGYAAAQVGADLEVRVAPLRAKLFPTIQVSKRERATLAVGYRRGGTLAAGGFGSFQENRFLGEGTFRLLLPGDILAADRNRFEGRLIDGDWSWRYRNRLQLIRGFDLGPMRLAPFANAEVFYDSRYDAWTRLRIEAGVDLEDLIAPGTVLGLYYVRQDQDRGQPAVIDGVGITVAIYR